MTKKSILHTNKNRVLATLFITFCTTLSVQAQRSQQEYAVRNGTVLYHNQRIDYADPFTFRELGAGYAKDRYNVYMQGKVLPMVDPSTFRLKSGTPGYPGQPDSRGDWGYPLDGYMKTPNAVLFNGKAVSGVSVSSFKDLGGGYAKDAFEVYFCGQRISGASSSSFQNMGDGYAKDAFEVYYLGKNIGASASSFKLLGNGYAADTWNTYYLGKKVSTGW